MSTATNSLTIEEQRAYLAAQRRGYELAEREQRLTWSPPTAAQKLAFDRLMQDTSRHRKTDRPCTMTEWYAALLRRTHE